MILSNSMESHNTIFTFCLYDKKEDVAIKEVTTNDQTAKAWYILFKSWAEV